MRGNDATGLVWPEGPPSTRVRASYSGAERRPYWFDTVTGTGKPDAEGSIGRRGGAGFDGREETDLLIVGGGLTGLWAALLAKQRDPGREVTLIEAEHIAFGASGRNGGFISSSLTHGIENGLARVPKEMQTLERLGRENLMATVSDLDRHRIECDLELNGVLSVALTTAERSELAGDLAVLARYGHDAEALGAEEVRGLVNSPTYLGALWQKSGEGLVNPVKLSLGLARAARDLGVRVHEQTKALSLSVQADRVAVRTRAGDSRPGEISSRRAVLATAAFPGLVPAIRRRIVPVYDYVLVTEPLSDERRAAVGWSKAIGVSDRGNQFHYYRPTPDGRILWGGYDAIYHYGSGLGPHLDQREDSFARLAQHFFHTFPQLEGIEFSHRWGGAIDACSRFAAFYGTAHAGRVSYAVGHTGLGVGASRFAAGVALDLADGSPSEATGLRFIRKRPIPFPPEPLRWAVIELTRNRLAAADRRGGARGIWLRLLDRLGLGFDS